MTRTKKIVKARPARPLEGGYSLIELMVTVGLITVASALAVMGVGSAQASMRLSKSAYQLANYLEKARVDAIRRHDPVSDRSAVILNATSFDVKVDFDGNGVTETRTIPLDRGVSFSNPTSVTITFDWRGRCTNGDTNIVLQGAQRQATVRVSAAGDISVNGNTGGATAPSLVSSVSSTNDISSSTILPSAPSTPH